MRYPSILRTFAATAAAVAAALWLAALPAAAQELKIGYSMAMTGTLGPNGKSALLAQKIWEEDVNAAGGLLGRKVKLVYYDDQSNGSTVPGIYTKLMDVDKVDLVIGGYATAMLAPAMPIMMQRKKLFIGLLGLGVNQEFNYPNYFVMIPSGPDPKPAFSKDLYELALKQTPKPSTVAIVAADQEFSRNASDGARENAKKYGFKIVYDKTYPPATQDFAPIVRAIAATNPDLLVICSYPGDSVGMVRAISEVGFKAKIMGGPMVGLQNTSIKGALGPKLNGFVAYDFWLPVPKMAFPGVDELMKKYQARAAAEGVDPLGYYMAPEAYAQLQVLGQAVKATKSLDDQVLADYIRKTTFSTVLGDVKFGRWGEWAQSRVLTVQFRNIKSNDPMQFKGIDTQAVVAPPEYASDTLIYPAEKAQ
jgi:branched-chain amino acid transport system substrate-binding protein